MSQTPPARFFRATALGVLAVGLAVPATASAVPPASLPVYGPTFQKGPTLDAEAGPVRFVLHGRFGSDGRERIAAVTVPGAGSAAGSDHSGGGISLFEETEAGLAGDRRFDFYVSAVPIAATAADLRDDGHDLIAVASSTDDGSAAVLEVVDPASGGQDTFGLDGQPVAIATGRFLPGRGPVVAVSLQDNVIVFYGVEDDTVRQVGVLEGVPTGPLSSGRRTDGIPGDALVASTSSAPGQLLELNAKVGDPDTYVATKVAGFGQPFGASGGRVAADEDAVGNRWFAYPSGDGGTLSSFRTDGTSAIEQNVLSNALEAPPAAPIALDLYGRGSRGVVAALDGARLRTFDVRTAHESTTPLASEGVGAALDVDDDRRDDLVVADGTAVTLYRNDTGTKEEQPAFTGRELSPAVYDAQAAIAVVTARAFELRTPTDTGDVYMCALDGGPWTGCRSDQKGPAFTVPADGAYELQVRRRASGTDFWSDAQTIALRVDTSVPAAPKVVGRPAALANAAVFQTEAVAGTRVEYRVDGTGSWLTAQTSLDLTSSLTDGPHTVAFRAVDELRGVTSTSTTDVTFTLDATRPQAPRLIGAPELETTKRSATFTFEGEAGGSYECRIDQPSLTRGAAARQSDPWETCSSPWTVDGLALGAHVVEIRQTDAAGNHGRIASFAWVVVAPTPEPGPAPAAPPAVVPDLPAPSPAPAPAPAPVAAPPIAARLEVGSPAEKGATPVATLTGRRVAVGCAAPGATGYRCTVTVTRGGKTVGRGRRTGSGVVPVDLDRATARKVQRLGGLKVRVTLTVRTADGRTSKVQKTVRVLPRKVLVVPTDGLFAFGSAKPGRQADALAKRVARQLDGARRITIVGHTDAKGAADVNRRLGRQRAEAFRRLLAKHGFDGEVAVRSAGDTQPRTSNDTEDGRALNRRVEIDVRY